MTLGVDQFKSKLVGGGARPNLFQATVTYPGYAAGDVDLTSFMCKAAQLPASTIEALEVPFRGRQLQVVGDRTFEPWTVTIVNDTNFSIRNALERWSNGMNEHVNNAGLANPADYKADMLVTQLDRSGIGIKTYTFKGAFPTSIGAIDVSYETTNEVEFTYDYWSSDTTS